MCVLVNSLIQTEKYTLTRKVIAYKRYVENESHILFNRKVAEVSLSNKILLCCMAIQLTLLLFKSYKATISHQNSVVFWLQSPLNTVSDSISLLVHDQL